MRIVFNSNPISIPVPSDVNRLRITNSLGVPVRFTVDGNLVTVANVSVGEVLTIEVVDDGIFNYSLGNEDLFDNLVSALREARLNLIGLSSSTEKPEALTDHGVPSLYVVRDCQVSLVPDVTKGRYVREGEWIFVPESVSYVYRPDYTPTILDQDLEEVSNVTLIGDDVYRVEGVRRYIVCTPIT